MKKIIINNDSGELFLKDILVPVLTAAFKAGEAILDIYESSDFGIQNKEDNSPLTIADRKSHEIIENYLSNNVPKNLLMDKSLPFLSEEGKAVPYEERKSWEYYWLVDPLDGTKEFIKRNGEFTVNIALIHKDEPVLGVVYVPVTGICYYSAEGVGAYKIEVNEKTESILENADIDIFIEKSIKLPIKALSPKNNSITVVASRSHMNAETENFIEKLKEKHDKVELITAGSSLKLCLVAEGRAGIYPRLGPTMEWDTAAAHAVVKGAGKDVFVYNSRNVLAYNKENMLNPYFLVE